MHFYMHSYVDKNFILVKSGCNTSMTRHIHRAHTITTHHYAWFQGQCRHPDALLGTSVKHLHFEDSRLKTLNFRLLN
jgi:hypothetical protein